MKFVSVGRSSSNVAIVGAGVAGLTCATELQAAGVSVSVFDKGRRPGGRMSTRHVDERFSFDHGCQYFSANDPSFERQLKSWMQVGVVSVWTGSVVELDGGKITPRKPKRTRYVGRPEMASVCNHLAAPLNVHSGVDVNEVHRSQDKWHLLDDTAASLGQFDGLIIATPPPQAEKFLAQSPSLLSAARGVRMSSCWTVMLAFSERLKCSFDGAVVYSSSMSWIARNSSKTGRNDAAECWVGQANANWSAARLEASRDIIAAKLAAEFCDVAGVSAAPDYLSAHRWKYAIPAAPYEANCLFDDTLKLGLCGDWCLGNRVETAWLSGTAAAKRLLKDL